MSDLESILKTCVDRAASDIHMTCDIAVTYRIHGRLRQVDKTALSDEQISSFVKQLTNKQQQAQYEEIQNVEFGFSFKQDARFRASIFKQRGHDAIALRLIPNRIMTLEEIGLPSMIKQLLDKNHGLILVTGPTGSGKSTTLASMIDYINQSDDRHIITIEDPIEYLHKNKKSIINQRELGQDTPSFAKALVESLRQDPDVILVGEMRDLATIETALTATETGHLVLSTVHTFGAARTIDRIIDAFPAHQQNQIRTQVSLNLVAVISQQLVPRSDREGRIAAFEIMLLTPAIQNLIRKGQTYNIPNEIQTGAQYGMISLQNQLLELANKGIISKDDAIFYSIDQEDVAKRLGVKKA